MHRLLHAMIFPINFIDLGRILRLDIRPRLRASSIIRRPAALATFQGVIILSSIDREKINNFTAVRFLRLPEVMHRTGLPRASIYEQMAQGIFPKPIDLSIRSRGWIESEVDAWIKARINARRVG